MWTLVAELWTTYISCRGGSWLEYFIIFSKNYKKQFLLLSQWKLIKTIIYKLNFTSKCSIEKNLKIHKFYYTEFNTPNPVYSMIPSVLEGWNIWQCQLYTLQPFRAGAS